MTPPSKALDFFRNNPTEFPLTVVLETSGPDPLANQLLGVHLLGDQESFVYWDLTPEAGETESAIGLVKSYPLVLFNAARCCTWLSRSFGVRPVVAADPMLAAFVRDPTQALDLQALATKHGISFSSTHEDPIEAGIVFRRPEELLKEPIGEMATVIRDLHAKFSTFPDWAEQAYQTELALVPVIAAMELRGIAVDRAKLTEIASRCERDAFELEKKLDALSEDGRGA